MSLRPYTPSDDPLRPGRIITIRDCPRGRPRSRVAVVKRVGQNDYFCLPAGMKTPVWVQRSQIWLGEEEYAREYFRPRKCGKPQPEPGLLFHEEYS